MKTVFLLMAEYDSPTIPLEDIREKYFKLSKEQAERKAKRHELPVPAFRTGGQRSPWFVHVEELAKFIDDLNAKQREAWKKINAA